MTSHLSDLVIARWVAKGIAKGEEGSAASGRERARWGAHLEACDDCAERAAAALLAADAPECAAAESAAATIDVQSYVERIRPELAPSAPAPVLRVLGRRPLRWALSAAACLVLAAGWMLLQRDFPLDPYGNSENGENGRNSENGKDGAGAAALPVKPPRIVQDLSNTGPRPALWTAADGSKVWRQPGAKLHLLESKDGRVSLSLESGQVDVEVVPQPAPFVIESKGAQIRVLGTRFTAHAFSLRGGGRGRGETLSDPRPIPVLAVQVSRGRVWLQSAAVGAAVYAGGLGLAAGPYPVQVLDGAALSSDLLPALLEPGASESRRALAAAALWSRGPAREWEELLADTGEPVPRRRAACVLLGLAGDPARVLPLLASAWADATDPLLRKDLLDAIARINPEK